MSMIGNAGYVSKIITVSNTALGLADMGFTDEQIRRADTAHISYISTSSSAPILYYWYTLEAGVIKVPVGGGTPEGHPLQAGGERMLRGVRNIRNFRVIAGSSSGRIAVTLSSFGNGDI